MSLQKITVWMIDDHELFRDGVSLFLKLQPDINMEHALSTPPELHDALASSTPDVLLMDISMPQQSGIDLARQILRTHPKLKIIFLTGNEGYAYLEQALKAGGRGFVPKSASKTEVLEAVRRVYFGDMYFPASVSQDVFKNFVAQLNGHKSPELTDRELEVLRCFANGMSFKEIEDTLHISKKTIEHHKKAIFDKLAFSTNADLVKYAIKHHIVEL
jgi:DNA-binding NarL/FixJ family response regulator